MNKKLNEFFTVFILVIVISLTLFLIVNIVSSTKEPTSTFKIGETFTYNGTRYCDVIISGIDFSIQRMYVNCYKTSDDIFYDIEDKELGTHHILYDPRTHYDAGDVIRKK